jgi:hypothetical protein
VIVNTPEQIEITAKVKEPPKPALGWVFFYDWYAWALPLGIVVDKSKLWDSDLTFYMVGIAVGPFAVSYSWTRRPANEGTHRIAKGS